MQLPANFIYIVHSLLFFSKAVQYSGSPVTLGALYSGQQCRQLGSPQITSWQPGMNLACTHLVSLAVCYIKLFQDNISTPCHPSSTVPSGQLPPILMQPFPLPPGVAPVFPLNLLTSLFLVTFLKYLSHRATSRQHRLPVRFSRWQIGPIQSKPKSKPIGERFNAFRDSFRSTSKPLGNPSSFLALDQIGNKGNT